MTQGKVISLEMTEIKWVTADLNQTASVCKRATSRWFFSVYEKLGAVRCTLVTGKPALGRN